MIIIYANRFQTLFHRLHNCFSFKVCIQCARPRSTKVTIQTNIQFSKRLEHKHTHFRPMWIVNNYKIIVVANNWCKALMTGRHKPSEFWGLVSNSVREERKNDNNNNQHQHGTWNIHKSWGFEFEFEYIV